MSDEQVKVENETQDIGQILHLPYKRKTLSPQSDSLQDVQIRFRELVNFIGEVLLASQMVKELEKSLTSETIKIRLETERNKSNVFPDIKIQPDESRNLTRNIAKRLFYSSIVHLATIYEVFLSELIEEILLFNDEWLESDERQLTAKEIFSIGDIDEIRRKLMSEKVLDYAMLSYPKKVKKFEKDFHVGLHQKTFPLSLFEVHDFLEVRNVIVHNDGYASEHYIERMSVYNQKTLLEGAHYSLDVNFTWLLTFGQKLIALCVLVDDCIDKKWETTRIT